MKKRVIVSEANPEWQGPWDVGFYGNIDTPAGKIAKSRGIKSLLPHRATISLSLKEANLKPKDAMDILEGGF